MIQIYAHYFGHLVRILKRVVSWGINIYTCGLMVQIACITCMHRTHRMRRMYAVYIPCIAYMDYMHRRHHLRHMYCTASCLKPMAQNALEMFEATPLFKFRLHGKNIGENLTSDSGAG